MVSRTTLVPFQEIVGASLGSVPELVCKQDLKAEGQYVFTIRGDIVDPLGTISEIQLLYTTRSPKDVARPAAGTGWRRVDENMQKARSEIADDQVTATIRLPYGANTKLLTFIVQARCVRKDKSEYFSEPLLVDVRKPLNLSPGPKPEGATTEEAPWLARLQAESQSLFSRARALGSSEEPKYVPRHIKEIDADKKHNLAALSFLRSEYSGVFSADGAYFLMANSDGILMQFDTKTWTLLQQMDLRGKITQGEMWRTKNGIAVSKTASEQLLLLDPETLDPIKRMHQFRNSLVACRENSSEVWMLLRGGGFSSAARYPGLCLCDLTTGKVLAAWKWDDLFAKATLEVRENAPASEKRPSAGPPNNGLIGIKHFITSSDGKTLIAASEQHLFRFQWDGDQLSLDDVQRISKQRLDRLYGRAIVSLSLNRDASRLAVTFSDDFNGRHVVTTQIFDPMDLSKVLQTIELQGQTAEFQFAGRGDGFLAQDNRAPLTLLNAAGEVTDSVRFYNSAGSMSRLIQDASGSQVVLLERERLIRVKLE